MMNSVCFLLTQYLIALFYRTDPIPLVPSPVKEIIPIIPIQIPIIPNPEPEPVPMEPPIEPNTSVEGTNINNSSKQRPNSVGTMSYNVYYKEGQQTTDNMLVANYARRVRIIFVFICIGA